MKTIKNCTIIICILLMGSNANSNSSKTKNQNLDLLISLAAEGDCTCNCQVCDGDLDGCWAYDYSMSGNEGYANCTPEQKEAHCMEKGAGWTDQHMLDVIPDLCDGPPPVVFY